MSLTPGDFVLLTLAFFVVATLYSAVGFGGGSSYLAILTLVIASFFAIRTTALLCNLAVVSGSCLLYYKNGHLQFKKFLPFIITSIPMAFLGAAFRLKEQVFFILLAMALIVSAVALIYQTLALKTNLSVKKYPVFTPYVIGAGIGLLSGLVGIGGGIFLAPVLHHMKWDKPIVIASLASFFILVNSISGIGGLFVSDSFEIFWPEILGLLFAVLLGGQLGVRLSISKLSAKRIRMLTAFLVLFVGTRVLLKNGLQITLFT
ncbi:sulfite exporter TauE/SafE family protein [Flagellimonas nanhaiensis]|uniref:Probable membrane transporter protein n=1 Tax=Flagellimonas nanhaiensis TaxID=2292706 RepID=A0A371JUX6_9FLAO|nr:sulfite exporter TauE/SafE family protein [Allomuricauda nanhaiensis]RDY61587.1 sulfite exporter TauE/SafE family protein [Allomuricauda nanhaiensis]